MSEPRRLTATPTLQVTVWVQEPGRFTVGTRNEVWMRPVSPKTNHEAASRFREGWICLTEDDWPKLRDCVDRFFAALNEATSQSP